MHSDCCDHLMAEDRDDEMRVVEVKRELSAFQFLVS